MTWHSCHRCNLLRRDAFCCERTVIVYPKSHHLLERLKHNHPPNPPVRGCSGVGICPSVCRSMLPEVVEHTDQSGWIINLNYLSNPLPTLQSTQPRSARAIILDECQPAGLCDSLPEPPGERRAFLGESSSACLEEGATLSGTPASFVCCLFPCTQMVHFEEAGCRFHPCVRFSTFCPEACSLWLYSLLFPLSLLRFSNTTWRLKTQPTLFEISSFRCQNAPLRWHDVHQTAGTCHLTFIDESRSLGKKLV